MRPSLYAKKRRSSQRLKLLISLGIFITTIIVIASVKASSDPIVSPIPDTLPKQSTFFSFFYSKKDPDELMQKVKELVGTKWTNYSIYVRDFNSDFVLGINESVLYTGASIHKIPILAALYYLAQKGEVDLDKVITLQESDIQDYGTGSIRYDPVGTTYSIKTLAQLMMTKSDNTAAYLIDNYVIGTDKIQKLISEWGLTQTDMESNKTSNKDMGLLMEKMYKQGIANSPLTQEMLSLLKDSDFEDRIPALLPESTTVYHKIGNGPSNIHDVGIVINGKTQYYIGILTSDIRDVEEATKLASMVSKTVYDYLR